MKLLLITTTNLSTNPRLLKEIRLASEKGFDFEFIAFNLGNWSDKTDIEHIQKFNNGNFTYLSAIKKPFLLWLISTVIWKICKFFNQYFAENLKVNAYAHNKRTWLINRHLKSNKQDFDLVISHNLGALYPALKYSKKLKIPFIFDIEDYHPGEKCSLAEKGRREYLMKKLLPSVSCITCASPLIGEYSFKLLDKGFKGKSVLINNSFPQNEFQFKEVKEEKVKFIWFSQNINGGRGLELLFPALQKFKNLVEVTLIGNLNQNFYQDFLTKYQDFLMIKNPMNQMDLNLQLAEYDIGLAIELDSADFNRQICLTNKIFAYSQSGLYILATNTLAQKQFILENNQLGILTEQTITAIESNIENIIQNIQNIREQKKNRFEYAKKLAWEHESHKLLNIWNGILIEKPESI